MKLMQLNLYHGRAAQYLLSQSVFESNVDVAIVSQQYKNLHRGLWIGDENSKAAIWTGGCRAIEDAKKNQRTGSHLPKLEGNILTAIKQHWASY